METADAEGAKVESAAADLIAILGDGSFRDTHGTLQKAIICGQKGIDARYGGRGDGRAIGCLGHKMIEALAARDAGSALSVIDTALAYNIDMAVYAKLFMQAIRHVLILRNAPAMRDRVAAETTPEELIYRETGERENDHRNLAFLDAYQAIPARIFRRFHLKSRVIARSERNRLKNPLSWYFASHVIAFPAKPGGSSNGRTPGFGPVNWGLSPYPLRFVQEIGDTTNVQEIEGY